MSNASAVPEHNPIIRSADQRPVFKSGNMFVSCPNFTCRNSDFKWCFTALFLVGAVKFWTSHFSGMQQKLVVSGADKLWTWLARAFDLKARVKVFLLLFYVLKHSCLQDAQQ